MAGLRTSRRGIRIGLATGLAGGLGLAAVRLVRQIAKRRAARNYAAFGRAAEGMWPAVPTKVVAPVRVSAPRADGASPQESPATGEPGEIVEPGSTSGKAQN